MLRPFPGLWIAVAAIVIPAVSITACGCELPGGEGDAGEHFAGIFRKPWVVAAFLGWDGVIQHRYDQLGITLQTNDGKLAQSHIEPPVVAIQGQRFVEHLLDKLGDLKHSGVLAFLSLPDFGTQHHGIQHFHHPHQFAGWI